MLVLQTLISHLFDIYLRPKAFGSTFRRIRIASSDLFKSHVIARETKRLQRDFAYKDELVRGRRKRDKDKAKEKERVREKVSKT